MGGPPDSWLRRVRTGASVGLLVSGAFSAIMVVNAFVHGGTVVLRRGGELPLFPLLPVYLLSGPVTGVGLAILHPLIRRKPWIAYCCGAVGTLPFFAGLMIVMADSLSPVEVLGLAVFCSATLGGIGGLIVRDATV